MVAGTDQRAAPPGQRRYRAGAGGLPPLAAGAPARAGARRHRATGRARAAEPGRRWWRMSRRAVITGIGVVAPGGIGTTAFWELLTAGRTATRTISLFDPARFRSRIAAEVDFDPRAAGLGAQEVRRMDRAAQFAVVCAREAIAGSGLELSTVDPGRIGVSVGSAVGCTMGLEEEYTVLSNGGRGWLIDHTHALPHLYSYNVARTPGGEVGLGGGARGPGPPSSTRRTAGRGSLGV